jgi:peptidoglycan-associated lipoprotein
VAAPTKPAVAAPSPAPTIEVSASPSTIERGRQTTLSWRTQNATSVLIDGGVGNVVETGSLVVTLRESTTFTAVAKGPGGEAKASTRVTVLLPQETLPPIVSAELGGLDQAISDGKVRDIFFEYDKADLTADSKTVLEENARWLRQFADAGVIIEGHCDERGTEEYNLALGDRRAQATKDYLVQLGVAPERLEVISYGEEKPFSPGHDETSWAQNRRAHFVARR